MPISNSEFRFRPVLRLAMSGAMILALAGCGGGLGNIGGSLFGGGKEEVPAAAQSPEQLFELAEEKLRDDRAKTAAFYFDEVERLYPYSAKAKDAMLMSAVASYRAREYNQAVLAAERFIGFYPSDDQTDYARYVIAQSYYEQIVDVGRDQGTTAQARQALSELITRHPDSEYAKDAKLKMDTTLDQLAGKEMMVGRYYLKRGNYIGAINRFQTVVREYDTTSHVEEALHRLVEANLALGLVEEAKSAAAVLGHNYPGGDWYGDSYAMLTTQGAVVGGEQDTWYKRAYRQVIKGDWL